MARVRTIYTVRTGGHLQVIETARDLERQREYVRLGVSRTLESRHLAPGGAIPARPSGARVLACDLAPSFVLGLPKWDPDNPAWTTFGEIALDAGLKWGGDWDSTPGRAPYDGWDSPHVYLEECKCRKSGSRSA